MNLEYKLDLDPNWIKPNYWIRETFVMGQYYSYVSVLLSYVLITTVQSWTEQQ